MGLKNTYIKYIKYIESRIENILTPAQSQSLIQAVSHQEKLDSLELPTTDHAD